MRSVTHISDSIPSEKLQPLGEGTGSEELEGLLETEPKPRFYGRGTREPQGSPFSHRWRHGSSSPGGSPAHHTAVTSDPAPLSVPFPSMKHRHPKFNHFPSRDLGMACHLKQLIKSKT